MHCRRRQQKLPEPREDSVRRRRHGIHFFEDGSLAKMTASLQGWGADGGAAPRAADLERLLWMGERLDERAAEFKGGTLGVWLAEALLKIRAKDGRFVPLTANLAQREFARRRGQKNIVLKARQMGISTWVAGRFFLKTITQPGTLTLQVAHSQDAAEQIFRVVHRFYERLPAGLRDGALRVSRANAGQLAFPALDSEYRVASAADENAGRGMTIQNLHCSEVARWSGNGAETLASLRAALAPEGELVLESTPNGAYGCFYAEWERAQETGTVRHFFPWWMESTYRGPEIEEQDWTEEERSLAARHSLTPAQIGYRRQLQAGFGPLMAQEYAESPEACFLASGNCVFLLDAIEARLQSIGRPTETRQNGALWIWLPPVAGRRYILGVDPAGGGSEGDYAAIQVIDAKHGLQCAELRGHLSPRELAQAALQLAREYNGALLAVERNNHGHGVLAHLEREKYPAIYEQNGQAGWLTTAVSRPRMQELISQALEHAPELFASPRLLQECRTYIRFADGRTGAAHGAHDDCVMAMGIALAVRAEGR
jgi:hypothetical protein